MVEERASEGRVEEVVGYSVLPGQLAFGHESGVVVAHGQPRRAAPRGELIHLAAVDLVLLLVEARARVARELVGGHVFALVERTYSQVRWEAVVGDGRLLCVIEGLR